MGLEAEITTRGLHEAARLTLAVMNVDDKTSDK